MKIGIVSPEFPPEKGGIQTYACEYARELARRVTGDGVYAAHPKGDCAARRSASNPCCNCGAASIWIAGRRFDIWHAMNASFRGRAETAPVFRDGSRQRLLAP
jgi:hypothetical protein